jgi:hypothetical protein
MVRSIYVPLSDAAVRALRALAARELREPKQQAAALILDGLLRAGLMVEQQERRLDNAGSTAPRREAAR